MITTPEAVDELLDRPGLDRSAATLGQLLLEVEQRFRDEPSFKDWYQKWYESLGVTTEQVHRLTSIAKLAQLPPAK